MTGIPAPILARLIVVATLGAALTVAPSASAQDVLIQGRAAGVQPPAEILRILAEDTTAFEFQRAWRARAADVRTRRAEIADALGGNYTRLQLIARGASVDGVMRVPVIPALYSDLSAPYTRAQYQESLFGNGSGAVSVTQLYTEMSLNAFTFSGTVLDWLDMPRTRSHYEPADERYGNLVDFLHDALVLADPLIDFGEFDNDGADGIPNSGDDDGYVDVTAFIYANVPQSCGGDGTGIWPHRWTYSSVQYRAGGQRAPFSTSDASANGGAILVDDYIIQSGVRCDGTSIMGAGTISHELGHALDLPDLYDTDKEDGNRLAGNRALGADGERQLEHADVSGAHVRVVQGPAGLAGRDRGGAAWDPGVVAPDSAGRLGCAGERPGRPGTLPAGQPAKVRIRREPAPAGPARVAHRPGQDRGTPLVEQGERRRESQGGRPRRSRRRG